MEQVHNVPDPERNLPLRSCERLVVRPVTADDADGLAALYDGLDADDRHFRFFGNYRPRREFIERAVTVEGRGGARLIALVTDDRRDEQHLVGEAGFTILADGNGELAMTVTPEWHNWLGPVLLDAVCAAAAAVGVPNLEVDVLTADHAMVALLRRRGAMKMEHSGWQVVRLLIGTATSNPSWPGSHERLRVLVEVPGGRWHAEDEARAAGFDVISCSGPTARRCPALTGETCALAAGADAIVVAHIPPDEPWERLVKAHRHDHPGVPVCLEPSCRDDARGRGTQTGQIADESGVVALVERLVSEGVNIGRETGPGINEHSSVVDRGPI